MSAKRPLLLALVMLVISSCSQLKKGNDVTDVMVSQECSAPCWRGITPGVTRFNEAWDIVQGMGSAQQNASEIPPDKVEKDFMDRYISVHFKTVYVSLSADEQGIIADIHFFRNARYRWENPKLKEFIEVYGDPESIEICHEVFERRRAIVYIYYPEMYLWFNKFLPINGESFIVPIQKNTRIDSVLFLPTSYERPLYDFSFSWTGYGDVTISPAQRNKESICTTLFPYSIE